MNQAKLHRSQPFNELMKQKNSHDQQWQRQTPRRRQTDSFCLILPSQFKLGTVQCCFRQPMILAVAGCSPLSASARLLTPHSFVCSALVVCCLPSPNGLTVVAVHISSILLPSRAVEVPTLPSAAFICSAVAVRRPPSRIHLLVVAGLALPFTHFWDLVREPIVLLAVVVLLLPACYWRVTIVRPPLPMHIILPSSFAIVHCCHCLLCFLVDVLLLPSQDR